MKHQHVKIAVRDVSPPGVEEVPARWLGGGEWQLLWSPLYATGVASGDVIKSLDDETGGFEIVARGGNVCIQFYLSASDADDTEATAEAGESVVTKLGALGGTLDGSTPGLLAFTVPIDAGFPAIDQLFEDAVERWPGSQWQYTNVYDPISGQPLGWWER